MELRQLKHFVVVAETLNISKASERLYISQPGLSKSISNLESSLGVQLFERNGSHLKLTPAGDYLLKESKAFLADAARIQNEISRFQTHDHAVYIGLEDKVIQQWEIHYTNALDNLRRDFPDYTVYTRPISLEIPRANFDLSEYDFALIVTHDIESLNLPHYRKLLDDEVGMLCHKDHLPDGTDVPSICRFLEHSTLLHLNYDFAISDHFLDICRDFGYTPELPRVVSPNLARVLIATQGDVAIVPRPFAFNYFKDDLVYVRFPSRLSTLSIYAVWDDHIQDIRVVDHFCDAFRKSLAKDPPFQREAEDQYDRLFDLRTQEWLRPL